MPKVPQIKSERVLKPATLDRKHAKLQQAIEKLPKSMTKTYTNYSSPVRTARAPKAPAYKTASAATKRG